MPINNFKLFDEKKANMMTDEEYAINQQRLNGVQSGVASSQLQNKTLYQTALMCYALAQLMAANGYDANDANAVSTFVNNLSLSMVQKVVDKASANDVANQVAGKWVDAKQLGELKTDVSDNYLSLLGGTMLGDLILHSDPTQSLQAATKQYVDSNDVVKLLYKGVKKGNQNLEIPVTWNMSEFSFLRIIINKVHSSWNSWGMNISLNNLSKKSLFTVSGSGNLSFNILLTEIYEKTSLRAENSGITFSVGSFNLYFDTPFNNVNKITFYGNYIDDDADFYIYGYKK